MGKLSRQPRPPPGKRSNLILAVWPWIEMKPRRTLTSFPPLIFLMPKLPSLKPREVVKKLKKLGFIEHHQVGSHLTLKNPDTKQRAVVPMHLKDIKRGTLASILREIGIDRDSFLEI